MTARPLVTAPAYAVRCRVDALPASVNALYRPAGRGRKVLSDAAVLFRDLVALALVGKPKAPMRGPLALSVWFTFPDGRRRDGDNLLKNCVDSLASALDFDDRRIVELHMFVERGSLPETELLLEVRP